MRQRVGADEQAGGATPRKSLTQQLKIKVKRMLNIQSIRTKLAAVFTAVFMVCALAATPAQAAEKVKAVATTGMIGDVLANIAGDYLDVDTLLGPGVDPHLYKMTRADLARMLSADIIFYNGLLLEGKMTDGLIRVATSGVPVVAVAENLEEDFLLSPEEFEGQYDPHVWMDVDGWIKVAEFIRDTLVEKYPDGTEDFKANAKSYIGKMRALSAYATGITGSLPQEHRVLVTAHDAFNYFGRRYGFDVLGIQGLSTQSEAGVRRIEELVDILVDRDIPAVFVETTISDRNIRALIEGAAARGHNVRIGGYLYSDAMGKEGTYEGTYLGMIDHNVSTIVHALGGDVPDGGMDGKLALKEAKAHNTDDGKAGE